VDATLAVVVVLVAVVVVVVVVSVGHRRREVVVLAAVAVAVVVALAARRWVVGLGRQRVVLVVVFLDEAPQPVCLVVRQVTLTVRPRRALASVAAVLAERHWAVAALVERRREAGLGELRLAAALVVRDSAVLRRRCRAALREARRHSRLVAAALMCGRKRESDGEWGRLKIVRSRSSHSIG
jgi:hypothetical protein